MNMAEHHIQHPFIKVMTGSSDTDNTMSRQSICFGYRGVSSLPLTAKQGSVRGREMQGLRDDLFVC